MRRITCRFFCLAVLAAPHVSGQALEPVTLVLQWQHQAQFAGYYMALFKNFYAQQGLDMRLLRGGADVRPSELLQSGKADFGSLMLSTALEERAMSVPVVHLAQVVNRGNFLLVAWREPGEGGAIHALSDLNGRRVSVWGGDFRAPYLALFASRDVKPIILPQYISFSLFLHRGAAAFAAMRYNEYHTLLQNGVSEDDVLVFPLHDYGIRLPEDGLYCLEDTWRKRERACRAFVRASLEGWRYARDHTEETLDVVMGYVEKDQLPTNRMHMRWMLKEMISSIFPDRSGQWAEGCLSREAYNDALKILTQHANLQSCPDFDSFVVKSESNGAP